MISDILSDGGSEIEAYLADGYKHPGVRGEVLAVLRAMDALRARLDNSHTDWEARAEYAVSGRALLKHWLHVEEYMADEQEHYETMRHEGRDDVSNHIWLHVEAINKLLGVIPADDGGGDVANVPLPA